MSRDVKNALVPRVSIRSPGTTTAVVRRRDRTSRSHQGVHRETSTLLILRTCFPSARACLNPPFDGSDGPPPCGTCLPCALPHPLVPLVPPVHMNRCHRGDERTNHCLLTHPLPRARHHPGKKSLASDTPVPRPDKLSRATERTTRYKDGIEYKSSIHVPRFAFPPYLPNQEQAGALKLYTIVTRWRCE